MASPITNWTFNEYCQALDTLHRASEHISTQYSAKMTRSEAVEHFAARRLLVRLRFAVQEEAEYTFLGKSLAGSVSR